MERTLSDCSPMHNSIAVSQISCLIAFANPLQVPRLISQLFESEIFIQIGQDHFQIPRDIFSNPGDSPNFFSLGFAVFFSTPGQAFPGLDRRGLLRPPTIVPPSVPNRSGEIFSQLLHLLRGYPLQIKNENHRQELLRDCRYFHLRGLEQKLIACEISYNLQRQRSEMVIRLEDIRPSGITVNMENGGWVNYARPFVDESAYELIVEIGGESTVIDIQAMRADFHGSTKSKVASLTQVVANKLNLPNNAPLGLMMLSGGTQGASPGNTPLSEDRVKVLIDKTADVMVENESFEVPWSGEDLEQDGETASPGPPSNTGKRPASISSERPKKKQRVDWGQWSIRSGLWRLHVQTNPKGSSGLELVFVAVKLEGFSLERGRNANRKFLS